MNSNILINLAIASLGLAWFFSSFSETEEKAAGSVAVNQSFSKSFPEFLINLDDNWSGFDEEKLYSSIWRDDSNQLEIEFRTFSDDRLKGSIKSFKDTIGAKPVFYKYTISQKNDVLRLFSSKNVLKSKFKIEKSTKTTFWLTDTENGSRSKYRLVKFKH